MENNQEKPTVSSPTSTALLCVGVLGSPTVIYSEKDQLLIEQAKSNLQDYEKLLMHKLRQDGINGAASEQEIYSAFINDKTRAAYSNMVIDCIRNLIPEKTIYTLDT